MSEPRVVSDAERRARLGRRHALAESVDGVLEAAESVVCLHATEPASVYLSARARGGATRDDVSRALYDDRSVVRQLAMRRTVFAFPADLLPAVRGSAAARVAAQQVDRLGKEVQAAGHARDGQAWVRETCAEVLAAIRDEPATTVQLRGRIPTLDLRVGADSGAKWGGPSPVAPRVLTVLAADGSVVRGENAGGWKTSRPVWTAVEDWLAAPPRPLPEAEGYAALVAAWLLRFGPGTEDDVVWWLGATKAAVRRALADVGAVTVHLGDGTPAYLHPDDVAPVTDPGPWAALLPGLDPSTMGWKERAFYLGPHREQVFDRNGNGGATAWWRGRIVGCWTQRDDGSVVLLPLEDLSARASAALEREARRLTQWLDGEVVRSVYTAPAVRAAQREG
ncbi:hypothetical protein GCM10011519_35120 [Marmoricola endophyticus]|uniref:Winged helix DNA-binding domain-containing protein n=1 Tax=Marmoricola endophyticus TaxID=2040280 RepID=A0A917F9Q5_9ACTN|nr:winged helix DNA-binding domain-containing protein [Marmoricola endophyticus]GGF58240.1 hypothetical protein GCM10011519_35120 [Marmoricola endophyticus]